MTSAPDGPDLSYDPETGEFFDEPMPPLVVDDQPMAAGASA